MQETVNIGIVGGQFMGRAHSNAWSDVARFYDLPCRPVLRAACDIDPEAEHDFARRLGWESFETSWEKLVQREDIDVIDICTPNHTHMPIAVAAARAGKHVICEKPLAMNAGEARQMMDEAARHSILNMSAFNYRRVPALSLAKNMIGEGKLGEIHHMNAVYLQDWLVDPEFPWVWRHDAALAGSGAHGDMNAHTIDLARYLVGEIVSVCGMSKVFVDERKMPGSGQRRRVTADDATVFMARFANGALGSFTATRFATGRKNHLRIELYGSKGSLVFNLERMNELDFFSAGDDSTGQGFRNILVTEHSHPYLRKWWPPGHIIGWEHTFIHEIGDFLTALSCGERVSPDFSEGYRCQLVLDAVAASAGSGKWISIET